MTDGTLVALPINGIHSPICAFTLNYKPIMLKCEMQAFHLFSYLLETLDTIIVTTQIFINLK